MLITDTRLGASRVDLRVAGGAVAEIAPAGTLQGEAALSGGMICPPFAVPHVHLDATQLDATPPNGSGTPRVGIDNWGSIRASMTADDVRVRALRTARWTVGHGRTRIGTANLLVHTARFPSADEMARVFAALHSENHLAFGSVPVIEEGGAADMLWFAADDPIDALRTRAAPKFFQNGEEVQCPS